MLHATGSAQPGGSRLSRKRTRFTSSGRWRRRVERRSCVASNGISDATFFKWRTKYRLEVSKTKRLGSLALIDTNVVSELRRPRPHQAVLDWIQGLSANDLHLSAVTIGEIQAGIEITREQDAVKAEELDEWLDQVLATYSVLPVDAVAFKEWARLMHRKSDTLMQDALIAAVAIVNRLTIVTRNVRDFQHMNVSILNPFNDPPTVQDRQERWTP